MSEPTTPLTVDVARGMPTDEEVAAVVAVVTESYEQEVSAAVADETPPPSAWEVSARGLRRPFGRELGWRRWDG